MVDGDIHEALRAGVIRALPRRPRMRAADPARAELRVRTVALPSARALHVLRRCFRWFGAVASYLVGRAADRIKGRRSLSLHGVRLRELFQAVGGIAVKVGQQLSLRLDFLPFEICQELGKLTDRVPPFPFEEALPSIEAALGAPLYVIFEEVDPEPIGSGSLACVFRGTLRGGEEVAVKVRRPGVEQLFVEDLAIVGFLLSITEILTLVRPGFFVHLYTDLRAMFLDELDFAKEANQQTIYRRYVKRDRLDWLRVPRVYQGLSSESVLVSELVRGHPSAELIRAAETNDEETLGRFAAEGIDPRIIARRLLEVSAWSFFECPVFQGDPHPGNLLLQPDNVIVMLDFGACGVSTIRQREVAIEMQRRLVEHDAAAAASVALAALEPLPYVDTDEVRRAAERAFLERVIVLRTSDAEWWERTSAALWLGLLEATREFQLPANQDLLRSTRATLLYDTIVARLDPTFDFPREFWRWIKHSERRWRRRERAASARRARAAGARAVRDLGRLPISLRRGLFWLNQATAELPRRVMAASNAGSYAASVLLRLSLVVSFLVAAAAGVLLLHLRRPDAAGDVQAAAAEALGNPVLLGVLGIAALVALRVIMARLQDRS